MAGDISIKNIRFAFLAIAKIKNWEQYFLDLFNWSKKKKVLYTLRDGTKFELRSNSTDRGIVTSVVLLDEYKIRDIDFDQDSIIIDIGGQAGIFSVFAAKKVNKVYAFEPTSENYSILSNNIKINKLTKKVVTFKKAVADSQKEIKIYLDEHNTGGHSAFGKGTYEKVQAISLKDIIEGNNIKKCDLLKLDAEGSEYDILYPLPKKYFARIKRIYMEYHDLDKKKRNHNFLVKFLRSMDYEVQYSKGLLYAVQKE